MASSRLETSTPVLFRFGSFELDLETAELRANGRSARLPEQPFQILQMLLLADGRPISREEIRNRLWPNDTVVEFDRSINTAMMKLRIALGDTGDKSRLIETLPRRGYRLMVPVDRGSREAPGGAVREAGLASLVGRRVSHYRVLGILGGGGMGLVYKGEDLKLNRPVALKFLPEEMAQDPLTVQRFEGEARTASSLNHANICTIHEVEEHEGKPFIVMELLEGETLRELIARFAAGSVDERGGVPISQVLDIAIQIAEGLHAAHQKGIIHLDIRFSPRWSPDGRYLAALSAEMYPRKIFLYDFQTRKWVKWVTDQNVGYPSWTADSRYLQYVESGGPDARVRRVKVGSSHPEDLFNLKGLRRFDGINAPWSDTAPDGTRMFLRDPSGRDIYALDVEFPP